MITLPKIALTETDVSAPGPGGKAPASAGDFLALLSQALPSGLKGGSGEPLTFADLKASATAKDASQASLAALLQGEDASGKNPLADILASIGEEDTLASLGKLIGNGKAQTDSSQALIEDDKALSSEDIAALSALFAMLPQQLPARTGAAAPTTGAPSTASVASPGKASLADALNGRTAAATDAKAGSTPAASNAQLASNQVVLATAAGDKLQAETSSTPSTPHASLTPLAAAVSSANLTSTQTTAPLAPHISAQLGTPEWQNSVSQHITLLTRQGQQSAELRLNPEDLGSVQIRLKIDDNQAQIQMVSAHSHVRSALEAALPVLRAQLADNGIELGQSSISSESFAGQSQADQQQQQQAGRNGGLAFADHEDDVLSTPASLQSAARGDNAVDIFA